MSIGNRGQARQREGRKVSPEDETPAAETPRAVTPSSKTKPSEPSVPPMATTSAALEWLLMVFLLLYGCYLFNMYQSDRLPLPLSREEAGQRGFSETSALEHVSALVEFGPHPVGTEALDQAMMYVYAELMEVRETVEEDVDFEIDLFQPHPGFERLAGGLFHGKTLVYANLRHLVVRIGPPDYLGKENAVLISTHIDTVVTSPGAGDCSSCVAVLLELVRALAHWARGFKHSVIFLLNTGEEEGLIGAHSFITQHPWSSTIRAAIDVESMGVGGRSALFQAGSDKWLLEQYARVATYPGAAIDAQDVFHSGLVKSATDFQVYREIAGLSGLDFGFAENIGVYHTKNDKIELLRAGSLQHIGDDLLALLKNVAMSDELEYQRTNSNGTEKMENVYFDVLGTWMVTYSASTAKTLHINLISQGLVLLFGSLYLSGRSAFLEFGLAVLAIGFTWSFALVYVIAVAAFLPFISPFPTPYVAHPWLTVGLFGAPAVFGALIGHALGRFILMYYLRKRGNTEEHVAWHAERWLFKAGIFQWVVLLALGTTVEAGSSYISLFWILPPIITYALFEAQFSPRQRLRGLLRGTLWLSSVPGVGITAVPLIRMISFLTGNLVRFDRHPGAGPLWIGNAMTGVMFAASACLLLSYMLPYAHRSGGLVTILTALTSVLFLALFLVMSQVVPAFTEDVGRGIQAVHVIDTTGHGGPDHNPHNYISLFSYTPGNLDKEIVFLEDKDFTCGENYVDYVSFHVQYGCMKVLDRDEDLLSGVPTLYIETDKIVGTRRITVVRYSSGSARRWNMAINSTAVAAFKLKTVGGETRDLVPGGDIVGVDGWHNVQYITDENGPDEFQLTLLWNSGLEEEESDSGGLETLLLKVRTDVNLITPELGIVLQKLPPWVALFGKSTSPYTLAYLVDLTAPSSL